MAPPLASRRVAFARFVQRQIDRAETARGWSVPDIAKAAAIGNATIYRWRDGTWKRGPQPEQIVAFCDALDIAPSAAFEILWPGKNARPTEPEPAPLDPDVAEILRKLHDPNTSELERYMIRETLRQLADRSGNRPRRRRTRAAEA